MSINICWLDFKSSATTAHVERSFLALKTIKANVWRWQSQNRLFQFDLMSFERWILKGVMQQVIFLEMPGWKGCSFTSRERTLVPELESWQVPEQAGFGNRNILPQLGIKHQIIQPIIYTVDQATLAPFIHSFIYSCSWDLQ